MIVVTVFLSILNTNGIPFSSENSEPRLYPIRCERKRKHSFLSAEPQPYGNHGRQYPLLKLHALGYYFISWIINIDLRSWVAMNERSIVAISSIYSSIMERSSAIGEMTSLSGLFLEMSCSWSSQASKTRSAYR